MREMLIYRLVSKFAPSFAIGVHALVLLLTWIKTAYIARSSRLLKTRTSISVLLLRDGSIYFLFVQHFLSSELRLTPFSQFATDLECFHGSAIFSMCLRFEVGLY